MKRQCIQTIRISTNAFVYPTPMFFRSKKLLGYNLSFSTKRLAPANWGWQRPIMNFDKKMWIICRDLGSACHFILVRKSFKGWRANGTTGGTGEDDVLHSRVCSFCLPLRCHYSKSLLIRLHLLLSTNISRNPIICVKSNCLCENRSKHFPLCFIISRADPNKFYNFIFIAKHVKLTLC